MTKISSQDVARLAVLSNLSLGEEETKQLQIDIDNIVRYISELQELDTSGVEPTYQVTGLEDIWRDDEVVEYGVSTSKLLSGAPAVKDQQIKVPKVL